MAVAAALLTGLTATASHAQIPVSKERPVVERDTLQVTTVRYDTVFVDRVVARVDTVTVYVRDTVEIAAPVMQPRGMNGYWGLGAGAAVPADGLDNAFDTGYNVSAMVGWRSMTNPWGLRFEGSYNQFSGGELGGFPVDEASTWGVMANTTLDFPWNVERTGAFYLTGGVGVHGFNSFDVDGADIDDLLDNEVIDEADVITESSTDFGVNAGAGLRFGVGGANLFLEGRWMNVFTEGNDRRFFPITLGVTF